MVATNSMTSIRDLLELRLWRAFDVDAQGRILAGSDESGVTQLVEIGLDGTARTLTDLGSACSGRYLHGERRVIVSHDDDGNERSQLSLLDPDSADLPSTVDGLTPLVRDARFVHDLESVLPGRLVYRTNRRNGVDFDIVLHHLDTGQEQVLYDGGGWAGDPAAHPDGDRVALTRPARYALSDQLLLVSVADGTVTELTSADEPARHNTVGWLGDDLIVTTNRGREFTGVARYDIADGAWHWLVTDDAHDLVGWPSPDGSRILVHRNENAVSRLALHAADGSLEREVTLPADGWLVFPMPEPVWSADSRFVTLTFSSPTAPGDVLVLDVESGSVRAVTDSAARWTGGQLSVPIAHWFSGAGGDIPCHVYPRTSTVDSLDGAAVVLVHGGPEAQAACHFNAVIQALAMAGFTVLVPNVRGSTGYGKAWYSADDVRNRLNSVDDLASLHAGLGAFGIDRAALWGGSYGGYMVLAGLAFQPELWSAGVDIVGMSSLVTFLENTSDYRRAHREREYGSLADDREFLAAASPLYAIDKMRAPLFVIHGVNDPRVPLGEAEQLRAELDSRGVPCELVVYPDEGHGLAKRVNRLDAYPRAITFVADALSR